MVVHPHEAPHLILAVSLHVLGALLRSTQPFEHAKGNFNLRPSTAHRHGMWRNHSGLLFRIAVFCSWVFDLTVFLHLTPMYLVGMVVFCIRGQTLGMYVYGLQCVCDDTKCHDNRRVPKFSSGVRLVVRQVLTPFDAM